jgi:hypothetical protein
MPKRTLEIAGNKVTLDARPDRLDIRDLPYRPSVVSLPPIYPAEKDVAALLSNYIAAGLILDQKSEGACTGFGLAGVINFLLWRRSKHRMKEKDRVSPRMLFHLAKFYDEWPGEDYEGSSCRGALKGWHRHGVCRNSLWPFKDKQFVRPHEGWDIDALCRPLGVYYRVERDSVVDLQAAIFDTGAVYVSANVHAGWEVKALKGMIRHKSLPIIEACAEGYGGHAFALVGYNDTGFIVQNSWGEKWGARGFAVLPYEDWVVNGTDAWVVGLGAPVQRLQQRQYFVKHSDGIAGHIARSGMIGPAQAKLKDSIDLWSEQNAYWHSVVTGNDGHIINRLPQVQDERDNVAWTTYEQPLKWFKEHSNGAAWRIALYAHGGLNAEASSIDRIRILGPYFSDNGVYPLFTTWKSGWQEIFANMLADGANKLFGGQIVPSRGLGDLLQEASDRALEVFVRTVLGKSMWSEMKENVAQSSEQGRGIDEIAVQLARLQKASANRLEIHLIGHSAGSFVCGRLLTELRQRKLKAHSCTLFAPACDLEFALEHFKPAIEENHLPRSKFRIYVLSDSSELNDTVGPYGKSLLYLVSRALERRHKTPLLGLVNAFDGERTTDEYWHSDTIRTWVKPWQHFFWQGKPPRGFADQGSAAPGKNLQILGASIGSNSVKNCHGCFDNNVEVIGETIEAIIGSELRRPVINLDY